MKHGMLVGLLSISVTATAAPSLEEAKAKFIQALPNTPIDKIAESPTENLFTVTSGKNVIYYDPTANVVFFGEFYSLNGQSITKSDQAKAFDQLIDKYLDAGIALGKPDRQEGPVVEFMAANCGYCVKYDAYMTKHHPDVNRIVFFVEPGKPGEDERLNQILCSETPGPDLEKLFSGTAISATPCDAGNSKLRRHGMLAQELGVVGTPTVFVHGTRIDGFKPEKITQLIERKSL